MSAVDQLKTILDTERHPVTPLRPHQVQSYREEAERLTEIVRAPAWVEGNRADAQKRLRSLNTMLEQQAPKPTDQPNEVKRLTDEVRAQIVATMQPREVMRRNPTGAVGAFIRHEQSPQTKAAIQTYKRAMWALDPTTTDPDHTNLEKYRPELSTSGTTGFMGDAQISGHVAMTPQAKANWPLGDATAPTALAQVKEREKKERKPMSEEQKQQLRERLAKAREVQAQKRAGLAG